MTATTASHRRVPLDRRSVVEAGVALADDEGIEALTMRRLADRLGFKAMALYNHIDGKDELLALMVDAVAAEIDPPARVDPPMDAVRKLAMATRAAFVRHRWAADLWLRFLPGPARLDHMEHMLRLLDASDLPADLAHHGFHAINNHVLGYTLQEHALAFDTTDPGAGAVAQRFLASTSESTHPHTVAHVHEHLEGRAGTSFELVLDLILDGLRRSAAGT